MFTNFVNQHAECPYIALHRFALAVEKFHAHPPRRARATQSTRCCPRSVSSEPKIAHDGVYVVGNEDVGSLDIAVNQILVVQELDTDGSFSELQESSHTLNMYVAVRSLDVPDAIGFQRGSS